MEHGHTSFVLSSPVHIRFDYTFQYVRRISYPLVTSLPVPPQNQSRQILDELIADSPGQAQKDNPHVRYAYIKYQWAAGDKPEALR